MLWRLKKVDQKRFVLFLAVLVGVASGVAAVVIKNSVHFIQSSVDRFIFPDYHNYLYFAFPLLGLLLTVAIVHHFIKEPIGHGIPNTLYAIARKKSIIKRGRMFYSIITSAITVGFGGSTGLEGPTVATGAAVGSNIGQAFRMNYKVKTLLIGCAAASSMAAIFQAPVAAIIFVLEVFMFDLTMYSLIPLLLSSVSAVITARYFIGEQILFPVDLTYNFEFIQLPYFIAFGVITGLFSLYFKNVYFGVSKLVNKFQNRYSKAVVGGLSLGVMIFLLPPLYGEGYETINALISDHTADLLNGSLFYAFRENIYVVILFVVALGFLKVFATSFTFEGGGIGGIFAPSLFIGAAIGFSFAKIMSITGIQDLPIANFTLVGMAGLIAGVLHSPLMAMFLIAEITGGYELFVPLMITVAISYTTSRVYKRYTVYTEELAKRGDLLTRHKDKNVLRRMAVGNYLETNFQELLPDWTFGKLVKEIVTRSKRNIFPVVDEHGKFLGIVLLDDIREILFDEEKHDNTKVYDVMTSPPTMIKASDNMEQ
ncbi:MAG: chloride channel protein, partial [Luteibaculum sp.]